MKFSPEVLAALQTLKDNAENDFERHRIAVLERDLTNPPVPEIVDDTHQKFDGEIYHKDTNGHYRRYIPLHRAVWQYYRGDILDDYCIHHIDENKANNNIHNLQMMSMSEHRHLHNQKLLIKKICPVCGKEFTLKFPSYKVDCCSTACSAQIRPKRKTPVEKICPACGKTFTLPHPAHKQIFCSKSCVGKINGRKKDSPTIRTCPYCAKTFTVRSASSPQICCSHKCATKFSWQKKTDTKNNKQSELTSETPKTD